ncbi:hypothetical protein FB550_11630 [Neobacillus bataviensis]|uniref:Uncharacterized protein n=1 Tax=Neobacillus bataviensis TaxID=220685 RepID=A0A561CPT6_9BACI|nr:hypothetical protein FB550_11630 [Neobacillus bataviensis]
MFTNYKGILFNNFLLLLYYCKGNDHQFLMMHWINVFLIKNDKKLSSSEEMNQG